MKEATWPFSFYIKIFNLNLLMIIRIILFVYNTFAYDLSVKI